MSIQFKFNLTSILLIIVLIAVIGFFRFIFVPGELKDAQEKYDVLKKQMENLNNDLGKKIEGLEKEKKEIKAKLEAEQKRGGELEEARNHAQHDLDEILKKIPNMPNTEVAAKTREYLNKYLKTLKEGIMPVNEISSRDIMTSETEARWSLPSMRVNLYALTEHNSFKFTIIPNLEKSIGSVTKQKNLCEELYDKEQKISDTWKEKYLNENKLRLSCEDLNYKYKNQLKKGKIKSLLIGSGIGAGVVILLSLLK